MSYRRRGHAFWSRSATAALFVIGAIAVEVIASILFSVVLTVVLWDMSGGTALQAIGAFGAVVELSLHYVILVEVVEDVLNGFYLGWVAATVACYTVATVTVLLIGRGARRRWFSEGEL